MDNDGIFWLNEKAIRERLDHKSLRVITIQYHSDHRNYRNELVQEPKNNAVELS